MSDPENQLPPGSPLASAPHDLGIAPGPSAASPDVLVSEASPDVLLSEEVHSSSAEDSHPPRSSKGDVGRWLGLPPAGTSFPTGKRPSYLFLGVVSAISLFADISTKVWAEIVINQRGFEPINIIGDNFNITLAYNQGGAWGLFASADKMVRLPFFLAVSVFAIFFIVSLYSRLAPSQKALKWGLPMVLGGALGNLSDRITRAQVIDFIDYRADWVMQANAFVAKYVKHWAVTDHWPTFNVADIAICIGVGLMGVDMISHRHRPGHPGSGGASGVGAHDVSEAPTSGNATATL
ncbi:MAG TPA: signal peptidase II [Polyangiaceae bacterium]|nr:signal peptidase II [Polyangiaceae bacterium]